MDRGQHGGPASSARPYAMRAAVLSADGVSIREAVYKAVFVTSRFRSKTSTGRWRDVPGTWRRAAPPALL